jgi:hypothetical protein
MAAGNRHHREVDGVRRQLPPIIEKYKEPMDLKLRRLRWTYGVVALCVCVGGWSHAAQSDDLEIWLASTPRCASCQVYDQAAKRRGYGKVLTYAHGNQQLRISIRHVDKASLLSSILKQLKGDASPANKYWPIELDVLVVENGQVLYSGNIAESSDARDWRYPDAVMSPPKHPARSDPSLDASGKEYERFFSETWNLEYFVAVALKDRLPRESLPLLDLNSAEKVPLNRANVILWGGAQTPLKNGLFISHRIKEIRALLQAQTSALNPRFITLYGNGPNSAANDTSLMDGSGTSFGRVDVNADFSSSVEGVSAVFSAVRRSHGTRNLLIHVGHSGELGIGLWGQLGYVSPKDVSNAFEQNGGHTIMISGGCNSGVFARAAQCGFFAAHPAVLATGCQLSPEAIDKSDDYLRFFFSSLKDENRRTADSNGDGKITLEESHWYSSVRTEDHQISYSTIDALADEYFAADPPRLPATLTIADALKLGENGDPAEKQALMLLTARLAPASSVELRTIVERNHTAQRILEHSRESSSAERDALIALPYKLMLPMLVRRLLYEAANKGNAQLESAQACEGQSIQEFLGGM